MSLETLLGFCWYQANELLTAWLAQQVMVTLSLSVLDRESGDWVIVMSHLESDIRNKKINIHISRHVTRGLLWTSWHHWPHHAEQIPSVAPPYLGGRAVGTPGAKQGSSNPYCVLTGIKSCKGCDQSIKIFSRQWAMLWAHANHQGYAGLGTAAGWLLSMNKCPHMSQMRPRQHRFACWKYISPWETKDRVSLLTIFPFSCSKCITSLLDLSILDSTCQK